MSIQHSITDRLKIRKALATDKVPVLNFCKLTWYELRNSAEDYIEYVFDQWVNNKTLYVVELPPSKVVATLNIVPLPDGSVWLEGLRVDPNYKRLGIATALTNFALLKAHNRPVRLAIFNWNKPSLALVSKYNPVKLKTYIHYRLDKCRGSKASARFVNNVNELTKFLNSEKKEMLIHWYYFHPDLKTLEKLVQERKIIVSEHGIAVLENEEAVLFVFVNNATQIEELVWFICKMKNKTKIELFIAKTIAEQHQKFLKLNTTYLNETMEIYQISLTK